MRRLKIILLTCLAASLIAGYVIELYTAKNIDETAYLREIAPTETFVEKKEGLSYYISDKGSTAFNTYTVTPSIWGYAGPIQLLLVLSPDGKIAGIRILEHRETKNYVHYMETPEYLQRFIGKSAKDPFQIDSDIDGITRATVSVKALADTVRESSRIVASNVLKLDVGHEGMKDSGGVGWILYLLLFTLAAVFYFITRKSKYLGLRDISLILSILVAGMYLSCPFSILHVFNLVLFRPSSSYLWYALMISTTISLIIAGRFYCGWLCPFGALSEFLGRLPFRKWSVPMDRDDAWRDLKYILLVIAAIIVFIFRRPEFGNYETYVTLFSFHGNFLAWSLTATALIANVWKERFWCRYLCPVGALTGALSRKENGYPSRHDCPMGNKPSPLISECIRCNRCYNRAGKHGHD